MRQAYNQKLTDSCREDGRKVPALLELSGGVQVILRGSKASCMRTVLVQASGCPAVLSVLLLKRLVDLRESHFD